MADKNLHLYIGEEIPIPPGTPGAGKGKNAMKFKVNPVQDCQELAEWSEKDKTHKFPGVQLLSSTLEQLSERSLVSRTLVIDIYETYFETPKKKKGEADPEPIQKERFHGRAKIQILEALKYAKTAVYSSYLYDERNKIKGKLYV